MEVEQWKGFLKTHPVFSRLSGKEIDGILKVSRTCRFAKGDTIIREGEGGKSVFLIGRGAVDVLLNWSTDQTIRLATCHQGEFFGEVALFDDNARRSATVVAAEDCELLDMRGSEFLKIAAAHPEIESSVINKLTGMLRDVNEQVIKVKVKSLDEKLDVVTTRLDSQQQATEAILRATQTIFEQTNTRANEIIASADRSRHRLMQAAGAIGTVISVFIAILGFLGVQEFDKIKSITETVKTDASSVAVTAREFEANMQTVRADRELAEQLRKDMQQDLVVIRAGAEELRAVERALGEAQERVVENLLVPGFRESIRNGKGDLRDAIGLYDSVRVLGLRNDPLLRLAEIELQMHEENAPWPNNKNYGPLLEEIGRDIREARDKVQLSYLKLVNSIALGKRTSAYDYDRGFKDLEILVAGHKDIAVQMLLMPAQVVPADDPRGKQRFCEMAKLLKSPCP